MLLSLTNMPSQILATYFIFEKKDRAKKLFWQHTTLKKSGLFAIQKKK